MADKQIVELDELKAIVRDGLANHTGEFANPWIFKGNYSHELLADILNDIMASERLFKNLSQLLIKERLERGIYELERLEYIPQMHGDWQKVIDDRITKLESELASLENQIKVRNRQRAEQRANLREEK